ncbi:MAG: putative F420-dependent enzyme [Pseudonocardiales bacterium]|nr:putative F420-dependent enzyme [Pseudonocardiales bacterium]
MTDVLPDAGSDFGRRVRSRLADEIVIWLTTIAADGTPQPNPVWFVWQDPDTVLIYNRSGADRLAHIARRPRVALNFNGDAHGGNIVVLTGSAEVAAHLPPPHENAAYLAKYGERITQLSGRVEAFSEAYPTPLTVRVDRVRGF